MREVLKPFLAITNGFVRRVLRSRFHWLLSRNVVLLEITGRRSGRVYLVPVNYRASADGITVMTYRGRRWWLNLRHAEAIPVYLKGRRRLMRPEIVTDDHEAITQGLVDRGWVRKSIAPAKSKDAVLVRLHMTDGSNSGGIKPA